MLSKSIEELLCSALKTCEFPERSGLAIRSPSCEADKFSRLRFVCPTPHDGCQTIENDTSDPRWHQTECSIPSSETRDDRVRRGLRNGARGVAGSDLDRQRISFRGPIQIIDFDEPKLRAIGIFRKSELLNDSQIAKSPRL